MKNKMKKVIGLAALMTTLVISSLTVLGASADKTVDSTNETSLYEKNVIEYEDKANIYITQQGGQGTGVYVSETNETLQFADNIDLENKNLCISIGNEIIATNNFIDEGSYYKAYIESEAISVSFGKNKVFGNIVDGSFITIEKNDSLITKAKTTYKTTYYSNGAQKTEISVWNNNSRKAYVVVQNYKEYKLYEPALKKFVTVCIPYDYEQWFEKSISSGSSTSNGDGVLNKPMGTNYNTTVTTYDIIKDYMSITINGKEIKVDRSIPSTSEIAKAVSPGYVFESMTKYIDEYNNVGDNKPVQTLPKYQSITPGNYTTYKNEEKYKINGHIAKTTFKLDMDGGHFVNGGNKSFVVAYGEVIGNKIKEVAKDGYTFVGWYMAPTSISSTSGSSTPLEYITGSSNSLASGSSTSLDNPTTNNSNGSSNSYKRVGVNTKVLVETDTEMTLYACWIPKAQYTINVKYKETTKTLSGTYTEDDSILSSTICNLFGSDKSKNYIFSSKTKAFAKSTNDNKLTVKDFIDDAENNVIDVTMKDITTGIITIRINKNEAFSMTSEKGKTVYIRNLCQGRNLENKIPHHVVNYSFVNKEKYNKNNIIKTEDWNTNEDMEVYVIYDVSDEVVSNYGEKGIPVTLFEEGKTSGTAKFVHGKASNGKDDNIIKYAFSINTTNNNVIKVTYTFPKTNDFEKFTYSYVVSPYQSLNYNKVTTGMSIRNYKRFSYIPTTDYGYNLMYSSSLSK